MPQLRPFTMPPRTPPFIQEGPPLLPQMYPPELGHVLRTPLPTAEEGPPPIDLNDIYDPYTQLRREIALNSPTSDWMYEPYQPTEEDLQISHRPTAEQLAGGPGIEAYRPSGLRRALGTIRDMTLSTAAGASAPTFIEGLGAGITQNMALDRSRQAEEAARAKAAYDWQKLQMDAAKTQAEIEKTGAETAKVQEETSLLRPRQKSQAELQRAQAQAARDAAELSLARAKHERAIAERYPQMSEADIKLKAAQAARAEWENKRIQAEMDAGLPRAEAELKTKQALRAAAEAEKARAETANMPEMQRIEKLKADALYNNSIAALERTAALAQRGALTPQVLSTARNAYVTARSRIMASYILTEAEKSAELKELEKIYGWALSTAPGTATAPAGQPRTPPAEWRRPTGPTADPLGIR